MSALLINGVPIECINKAAIQYHIPAPIIISVLKIENGKIGDANINKNGTRDYGPMQINTIWIKQLQKYGYTLDSIRYNPCINVQVGTWILGQKIAQGNNLWEGIGDYHSHNAYHNAKYRYKVGQFYRKLIYYLHHGE